MLIVSTVVLITCLVFNALGYDSFIQNIGYLASGYLFGRTVVTVK